MNSIFVREKDIGFEELKENIECDCLVIGGGIAGFLTAYKLASKQVNVVLVESKRLFTGATQNTTAFLTPHQGPIYQKMSDKKAKLYYEAQIEAIREYKDLIAEHNISCDLEKVPSFLFSRARTKDLRKEKRKLEKIGFKGKLVSSLPIFLEVNESLMYEDQACHFSPIDFLNALPIKFKIYEKTTIIKVDYRNKICYTKNHFIKANNIILATKYPIVNIRTLLFAKLFQSKTYAIAIKTSKKVGALLLDNDEAGYTFRDYRDLVIVGGCDHRTGKKKHQNPFIELEEVARKAFGEIEVVSRWCEDDCQTFDKLPMIGKIRKNLYIITGFNKWGMANSMFASNVIASLISGKKTNYQKLVKPRRTLMIRHPWASLRNLGEILLNFGRKFFYYPKSKIPEKEHGLVLTIRGQKKACYVDDTGKRYFFSPYCPHMRCELAFDEFSKTWECPCHGSRFNAYGERLDAPSIKDMSKK